MTICNDLLNRACYYPPGIVFQSFGRIIMISLIGEWDFAYRSDGEAGVTPALPEADEFDSICSVPGHWDDQFSAANPPSWWSRAKFNPDHLPLSFPEMVGPVTNDAPKDASLPHLVGTGFYRKRLQLQSENTPTAWRLEIEEVFTEAWAWFNGVLMGHHRGYAAPFEVWLDPALVKSGDNELIIAVSNVDISMGGLRLRGFKGHSASIGDVRVTEHPGRRIADVHVVPTEDLCELAWSVELETSPGSSDSIAGQVEWRLVHDDGSELISGNQPADNKRLNWRCSSAGVPFWSDQRPDMVTVELAWTDGSTTVSFQRRIGLRRFVRDDMTLKLNGEPVYLRGATEHCYFAETCTPPFDPKYFQIVVSKLKEIGFNWLRCHTWVPSEPYLNVADELGLMVQVELPLGLGEVEWEQIVRRCRRHPSVVLYCGGNEELCDDEHIAFWGCLRKIMTSLDDAALFMPQEAMRGIEYKWQDSCFGDGPLAEEPFTHHPERLKKITAIADVLGHYDLGQLSYNSTEGTVSELNRRQAIFERPLLSHELGILESYLDPDLRERYAGTRIGEDLYEAASERLARYGLGDRWTLYYQNSCRWQSVLRKHVIEKARLCTRLNGYDFLGGIHSHWHRSGYGCGCLNEFYEFKHGDAAADFLEYNNQSILLLDHGDSFCHLAGSTFSADILAAWYESGPMPAGTLKWKLFDAAQTVRLEGELHAEPINESGLSTLGILSIDWPEIGTPEKFTLLVEHAPSHLCNKWHFWVFPKAQPVDVSTKTRVVTELAHSDIEHLENGGNVLLFGHSPFRSRPASFQMNVAGRPGRHSATVITSHPALGDFPHEGWCDWQFRRFLDVGRAVDLWGVADRFATIIEAVGSYKAPSWEAMVFEAAVSKGRLVVCAGGVLADDPAGAYLQSCLTRYADATDLPEPKMTISPAALHKVIDEYDASDVPGQSSTDMGYDVNVRARKKKK